MRDVDVALFAAARQNDASTISQLISNEGANALATDDEAYGQQPLHTAAVCGGLDAIQALLDRHGADINVAEQRGFTCLHLAAKFGKAEVVDWLLSRGAAWHTTAGTCVHDDFSTPLHHAAEGWDSGAVATVRVLLKHCYELAKWRNGKGQLPIDVARSDEIKALIREAEQQQET